MNVAKTIQYFWLIALCQTPAAETNSAISRIINRPIEDVRAALQKFSAKTNTPSGFVFSTKDLPGISYTVEFADCAPPALEPSLPASI